MITHDDLRRIDEFADLDETALDWLIAHMEEQAGEPGDRPFEEGAPTEHLVVLLEGSVRLSLRQFGQWRHFGNLEDWRITGLLPYSRMTHYPGRATVVSRARFAYLHKDHFSEMLYRIPALGQRLVARLTDRVREFSRQSQHGERMMALGKLAAGLAHELNNPASAAARASAEVRERLERLPARVASLAAHGIDPTAVVDAVCQPGKALDLDPLDRSEAEEEMAIWLEQHGVPDPWVLAPTFVDCGVAVEDLAPLAGSGNARSVPVGILWLEDFLALTRLAGTIYDAAARISTLVSAIKGYSHLDRAPDRQPVDLRAGIDSTLVMLQHKIRRKSIAVDRQMPATPLTVTGYPGELNQVWTNLIDNAIDAMPEGGRLGIAAAVEGESAVVRISDTGSGISPEIVDRIFDPFFTTKEVGTGSGLGLDIVARIVRQEHGGDILVASEPGNTTFTVVLPLDGT